jgi:Ser/Thr protein kinase RdoA (MazF antagonist)
MIYSYGILELVILCARINLCPTNPLQNLLRIIVAYNKVKKLSEDEKKVLFPLIKVRLAFLYMLTLATEGPDLDPYV